jgi:hypothetical protein
MNGSSRKNAIKKKCSEFLDQRDQAKLQWSQDPSHINAGKFER